MPSSPPPPPSPAVSRWTPFTLRPPGTWLPLGRDRGRRGLYGELLRHDPADPHWINRDRFVLSAGHGSMFLYAWLHLSGYPLSLDEVKHFRALGSKTPGHPEFGHTAGVEATTGPLGQGVGNAVGHAIAAKMLAARFNTSDHVIFDHTIWALAGDGCLQEGSPRRRRRSPRTSSSTT